MQFNNPQFNNPDVQESYDRQAEAILSGPEIPAPITHPTPTHKAAEPTTFELVVQIRRAFSQMGLKVSIPVARAVAHELQDRYLLQDKEILPAIKSLTDAGLAHKLDTL